VERACRAAELGGSTDFSAVLADPRVEAVMIATPPAPRFELARRFATDTKQMVEKMGRPPHRNSASLLHT
jgi:predicted dehydrogenase